MIHLHEIDNDGRGENTFEISRDGKWIGTVDWELAHYITSTLEFLDEPYVWHRIDEYYAQEA